MEQEQNPGVQALVQGLRDGGVLESYNYPGFFSHEIFRALGGTQISLNERVAYAEAFGASLAGKRSVVAFKNVGLNIASDAYLHSVIAGVEAGMVVIVTDDIEVWGSQESQDSRNYFDFFGGLWLEPESIQGAYTTGRDAFELSERFDVPVVIRLTNAFFEQKGNFERTTIKILQATVSDVRPEKYVVHPVHYAQQQLRLDDKNSAIQAYVEKQLNMINKATHQKGIVRVGSARLDESEMANADVVSINTYPLPLNALRQFAASHKEIEVLEDGKPFVAQKLSGITSDRTHFKSPPSANR